MGRNVIRCCDCGKTGDSNLERWGEGWVRAGNKKPEPSFYRSRLLLAIRPNVRDADKRRWICRECLHKRSKSSDKEFREWILKMDKKVDDKRKATDRDVGIPKKKGSGGGNRGMIKQRTV